MTEPSILHLGQVVIDLSMDIDHLPERGGDIFARQTAIKVGGGYNVIQAARRMGAPVAYMGGDRHRSDGGHGPWSPCRPAGSRTRACAG